MSQITGGKVTFGRTVQPAQFESKRADIELTFTLAENEKLDKTLDVMAVIVKEKVLEMVGLRSTQSTAGDAKRK